MQQRGTGDRGPKLEDRSFHVRKSKRATIYFEPKVHKQIRLEAARSGCSMSHIVNGLTTMALGVESSASLIYEQSPLPAGYVQEHDPTIQALLERVEALEKALGVSREHGDVNLERVIELISSHSDNLKEMGVKSLSLFGSLARGEAGPDSDIDLLVEFDEPVGFFRFFELEEYLEQLLERKVDLTTPDALRDELKEHILKEAIRAA